MKITVTIGVMIPVTIIFGQCECNNNDASDVLLSFYDYRGDVNEDNDHYSSYGFNHYNQCKKVECR